MATKNLKSQTDSMLTAADAVADPAAGLHPDDYAYALKSPKTLARMRDVRDREHFEALCSIRSATSPSSPPGQARPEIDGRSYLRRLIRSPSRADVVCRLVGWLKPEKRAERRRWIRASSKSSGARPRA